MIQKKYFSFSLCIAIFLLTTISINAGVCNFFERLVFGFTPAQLEDKELCAEAKEFLKVPQKHQLYYARWPWNYFCSFTQHSGTWVDKETWEKLDLQDKIFTMYHEISHKALNHPIKQYAIVFITLVLSAYCTHKYCSPLLAKKIANLFGMTYHSYMDNAITSAITSNIILSVSSFYNRQCEQEADEKAIEALCNQERSDIVEYEIDRLEQVLKEHGNIKSLWFASIINQINYFKKALAHHS